LRLHGSLARVGVDVTKEDVNDYVEKLLNDEQKEELRKMGEIDLSLQLEGIGRFRINIYRQKETYAIIYEDKIVGCVGLLFYPIFYKSLDKIVLK